MILDVCLKMSLEVCGVLLLENLVIGIILTLQITQQDAEINGLLSYHKYRDQQI